LKKAISIFDSGIVRKRIGAFEQIFVQTPATMKQATDTAKIATDLAYEQEGGVPKSIQFSNEEIDKFLESAKVAEPFIIGSTHIYNGAKLQRNVYSYLKKKVLSDMSVKVFTLSCGVYGDRSRKPPVLACAVAVRMNDDAELPSVYVALTIRTARGLAYDPAVYGTRKVSIFSNDFEGENIFERLFDIVPNTSANEHNFLDEAEENEQNNNNNELNCASSDTANEEAEETPFKNLNNPVDPSVYSDAGSSQGTARKGADYLELLSTAFPDDDEETPARKRITSIGRLKPSGLSLFGATMQLPEKKDEIEENNKESNGKQSIFHGKYSESIRNAGRNTTMDQSNVEKPNPDNLVQNDEKFEDDEYDAIFKQITGRSSLYANDSDQYTKSLFHVSFFKTLLL
jgi:hypothetical protein